MIQLGVPILKSSYTLLAAGQLNIDYGVFYRQFFDITPKVENGAANRDPY